MRVDGFKLSDLLLLRKMEFYKVLIFVTILFDVKLQFFKAFWDIGGGLDGGSPQ